MTASPFTSHRRKNERGFIIVAVLWLLSALSALVLIYLNYVSTTAIVVAANSDRPQTEALVSAGVELAAYQLLSVSPQLRAPTGRIDTQVGPHRVIVSFASEAGRIDLNAASKGLLTGLFTSLGASFDAGEAYADRVMGWRRRTNDPNDPETALYRTSKVPYDPRHGPFPQAEELWLVRGIPADIVERAMPLVTTYSNSGGINVAAAAPQALAALPNMTQARMQAILVQRTDPRVDSRALAALAGEGATADVSRIYRIGVAIGFDNGRKTAAEAVIMLLDDADEPYRVLSWRNLFDGDASLQQTAAR